MRSATAEENADGHRCRRNRVAVGRGDRGVVRAARFVAFHHRELPALSARHGQLVVADLRGVAPLAFRTDDGTTFTWVVTEDGVRVVEGDAEAATRRRAVRADVLRSSSTSCSPRRAPFAPAGPASLVVSSPAGSGGSRPSSRCARAARSTAPRCGRRLVDRAGDPLDLHQAFAVDDDLDEMRHFLNERRLPAHQGGLHRRRRSSASAPRSNTSRSLTTPGDPFSWWSINADGDEVVTRINYLGRHSQVLAGALRTTRACCASLGSRARTCASATTGSTARWCSSSTPTS